MPKAAKALTTSYQRKVLNLAMDLPLRGAERIEASMLEQISPDAELLALRPRLEAAVAEVSASEMTNLPEDASPEDVESAGERISAVGAELSAVCRAIISAPAAHTAQGRALKAAAAMVELRFSYCDDEWPSAGEELAWLTLSEIAGTVYVPVTLPGHLRPPHRAEEGMTEGAVTVVTARSVPVSLQDCGELSRSRRNFAMSQQDQYAQKRHTQIMEKVDNLMAEPFDNSGTCEVLCQELENVAEELDDATGALRARLLARLHAIQAQRSSLHCRTCFFQ